MPWNNELTLPVSFALAVFLYFWGIRNVWRRAGVSRGITLRHCIYFLAAILALVVALLSPLDAWSEVLFSAHMVQHLILILVAAPLLVLSDFPLALLWALPRRRAKTLARRLHRSQGLIRLWHGISSPASAWLFFTVTFWVWHTTILFEAALRSQTIHAFEHLGFLSTAMLFWWVLLKHTGPKVVHYGIAIPYLFTTVLQGTILGALITFSTQPWYPYYTAQINPWGLTALQDQQLAGLIMWLPGGAVFTLLTIGYFAAWLHSLEQLHRIEYR